jgi:hypothetical protein
MSGHSPTAGIALDARHSHLFPGMVFSAPLEAGALGRLDALDALDSTIPALVRFGDGAQATGSIERVSTGRWALKLGPYRTAAGTEMAARNWDIVSRPSAEGERSIRVASRRDPR